MADPLWEPGILHVYAEIIPLLASRMIGGKLPDQLVSKKILTLDESKKLRKITDDDEKARELVDILRRKPKPSFAGFCEVLESFPEFGEILLKIHNSILRNKSTTDTKGSESLSDTKAVATFLKQPTGSYISSLQKPLNPYKGSSPELFDKRSVFLAKKEDVKVDDKERKDSHYKKQNELVERPRKGPRLIDDDSSLGDSKKESEEYQMSISQLYVPEGRENSSVPIMEEDKIESTFSKPSSALPDSEAQQCNVLSYRFVEEVPYLEEVTYDVLRNATNQFSESDGNLLGYGHFGKVYAGRLNFRGVVMSVAVKTLKPPKRDGLIMYRKTFSSEMKVLAKLHHPNVVRLLAYCVDSVELCLVYELVRGGTLREALSKKISNPLNCLTRVLIARDISDALAFLHKNDVIHRDLKTSNLLLSEDKTIKVADFGLSTYWNVDSPASHVYTSNPVGTRCYMPPEACKGIVSTSSDVYAFGMVLYEIATGLPPYSHAKKADLITYMHRLDDDIEDMIDPRAKWHDDLPMKLFKLAKRCSNMDRSSRPPMEEIWEKLKEMSDRYCF